MKQVHCDFVRFDESCLFFDDLLERNFSFGIFEVFTDSFFPCHKNCYFKNIEIKQNISNMALLKTNKNICLSLEFLYSLIFFRKTFVLFTA